jgi:hypothetical protein
MARLKKKRRHNSLSRDRIKNILNEKFAMKNMVHI